MSANFRDDAAFYIEPLSAEAHSLLRRIQAGNYNSSRADLFKFIALVQI